MKRDSDPSPATLIHLAMFWDRLSETITKIAIKNQVIVNKLWPTKSFLTREVRTILEYIQSAELGKN